MANGTLEGMRVAIMVADEFEQVEMTEPRKALEKAGAYGRCRHRGGTRRTGDRYVHTAAVVLRSTQAAVITVAFGPPEQFLREIREQRSVRENPTMAS